MILGAFFRITKHLLWVLLSLHVVLGVALPPDPPAELIPLINHAAEDFVQDVATSEMFHVGFSPFQEMLGALATMQDHFFEVWLGQWSTTIDWTGAVMGTYLSSCMTSMLHAQHSAQESVARLDSRPSVNVLEASMNKYFSQVVSYYFGENTFDLRNEAYDDILWVVLGWLEALKYVKLKSSYAALEKSKLPLSWWGEQFSPAFAHRAHIFYNLAESGWDEKLCGGGLTWNSRLEPYKNTITNTLFITASVNMYLYHPGDNNASPYQHESSREEAKVIPPAHPHDQRYLKAAITGYDWLRSVNLTNELGLYVDGYHIRDWRKGQTTCNVRNEMVYTYNQGVLLSGLRGLWESTGNRTYLEHAHELVGNVITATGWSLVTQNVVGHIQQCAGCADLGSAGILNEACDPSGTCSQDDQTFKGIFFHHLTALCAALPIEQAEATIPGISYVADPETATLHRRSCSSYAKWVARNAEAALKTKNEDGLFGMWWGDSTDHLVEKELQKDLTGLGDRSGKSRHSEFSVEEVEDTIQAVTFQESKYLPLQLQQTWFSSVLSNKEQTTTLRDLDSKDINGRGRGRTVETQSGGLMVMRALWDLLREYGND